METTHQLYPCNRAIKLTRFLVLSIIFLLSFLYSYGQAEYGTVTGTVIDSTGSTLSQVAVNLKGSTIGTYTNDNGEYILSNVPEGNQTIVFQFYGYKTIERPVTVRVGETSSLSSTKLLEDVLYLEDVNIAINRNKFAKTESDYVSKLPLKNLENAQAYSTVSKELMKEQMAFSVEDGLKNVPGLQKMWDATGRGGDGGAFYNLRGFIVQSQLRNGVAGNVTSRIDAANLERVEVIKGPSATLFGSTLTSYGGLINRVTKRPYDHFGGEFTYASGSYGFNRISADINTPLDKDKNVLFRLNTAYNYEGSFFDNGFQKSMVIAPSFRYKVSNKLSFNFDAELFSGAGTGNPFIFFYYPAATLGATRADQLNLDYKRSYSSNDIYQTSRSQNYFGQINYKLSKNWVSQTNFSSSHSYSDGPLPYYYLVPNSVVTGIADAKGADYLVRAVQSTAGSEMQVTEIQQNFIGNFNIGSIKNRVVAGLDFFHQNSNQMFYGSNFDTIQSSGTIPNYSNFNKDNLNKTLQNGFWTWPYEYKTSTYSAYAADVINLTDRIIASAALRVDHFDNKGTYSESTGKYTGEYQQTVLSPKFGLVFQPIKNKVSLFANYQNGFTNKTGQDFQGKVFKPEHANQIETGVKLDVIKNRLSSTISYYNIQVTDVIRASNIPNFSIQDGTQLSKGLEVDIIASPINGLNIIAGFAYNDSKLTKADADVEGRRPVTAMSPYVANFWASYKIQSGQIKGLGGGFGGNYASDNKILNSVYYGEFTLPAYTVLNATVFYETSKYRLGVKVDNLTDKKYWTGYTTMNPQKLRSITGSISYRF